MNLILLVTTNKLYKVEFIMIFKVNWEDKSKVTLGRTKYTNFS